VHALRPEPPHRASWAQAEPAARIVKGGLNVSLALYHQLTV